MQADRRSFLRAAAAGGVAYAFGRVPGTVYAQMAGVGGFTDYKALVCLFLFGGNDSWNMFLPTSDAEYNAYLNSRGGTNSGSLAIDQSALVPVTLGTPDPSGVTYGFHPSMPEMATLFQNGQLAVVVNVGPLIQPTTKIQYQQNTVTLPPQLFSHNDQQDQWNSLKGHALLKSGWAGRIADALNSQLGNQQLPLNVSLAGQTLLQAGDFATPYVLGATGAAPFSGFATSGVGLARRQAFQAVVGENYSTVYERGFAAVQSRALQFADRVNGALATAHSFTALPDTGATLSSLSTQLRTVAKLISVRDALGMSRQVFFVSAGGFDTHYNQNALQPGLLADISFSLNAFYQCLTEIGTDGMVTTFTQSDFGRTLTSNSSGSDHAWGGVQLVMGSAVIGNAIYGKYPLLQIGNDQDVGGGRFIPTTSADQYAATLARWFGIGDPQLAQIAPNLNNFTQRDLGFVA
jgi:uncharacterized protein (DUF1501 family)